VEDLDGVGRRLDQAREGYEAARNKLDTGRGNVLGKARAIVRLGARVKTEKVQNLLGQGAEEDEAGDGAEQGAPPPTLP
jgi:DNA recombination protein RmuC